MKSIKIFSIAFLSLASATIATAQIKSETFKVSGNCGMCKTKIENAAKEAGAKSAIWDVDAKTVTVSYKSSSTNTAKIQQKIAQAGYDNAGAKASTESYNKLHGCCKYERSAVALKVGCCADEATCTHHEGVADNHSAKAECCKDGKCTKAGHDGKDCCKKAEQQ